jgi:hypothetical protein
VYNVFKRPMFKRGGTAQGSGIMSHVEARPVARVKAAVGFPTFGLSQEIDQASLDRFRQAEAERKARIGQPFDIRGPKLTDPNYGSRIQQFGTYNRYLDDAEKQRQMATSNQQEEEGIMQIAMQQEYARKAQEEADRLASEKAAGAKEILKKINEVPGKTEGMTKEEEINSEAKYLKTLLEDKDMTKGEIALILAESLATPGGFNKKLEKARSLAIPLARQISKEDKAYKLEAYKRYKDKEEAKIKYGQPTSSARDIKTISENLYQQHVIDTGGKPTKTQQDFAREYYVSNAKDADKQQNEAALNSSSKTIIEPSIAEVRDYGIKLKEAKAAGNEKNIKTLERNLNDALGKIELYKSNPAWSGSRLDLMLQAALRAGKKNGGRIGYALGSPMSNTDEENTMMKEEEDTTTPSGISPIETQQKQSATGVVGEKPVEKLDYATLRARLPKEINDQVVALLSSSEAALQDFAYITTQNDVNNFNIKYGVNLIIPPTTQQA